MQKHEQNILSTNIKTPNKLWSTDITYIKPEKGFVYLAVIIDWYSKKYSPGNSQIQWLYH